MTVAISVPDSSRSWQQTGSMCDHPQLVQPFAAELPPKRAAPKGLFCQPPQADRPRPALSEQILPFRFSPNHYFPVLVPSRYERRFAIVTNVEAGCGGRVDVAACWSRRRTASIRTVKSRGPDIPTLVSSRRQCSHIALTTVANKPGAPGRTRSSR